MMMATANHFQARADIAHLLKHSLPGARKSVSVHVRRAQHVAELIWRRFQVGPHRWQTKHIRWALEHGLAELSAASRYDYWRSIEKTLVALGRRDDWLPFLLGPWLRPSGDASPRKATGRPPRLPVAY
jgi:hypothetical protein